MKMDIVISGVGGQGNIFASLAISQFAMRKGHQVIGAETIGAAQRGGSVVSHIRISDKRIYAPMVSRGQADLLIGMEAIEMLRHMRLLNPQGTYLLNFVHIPTVLNNMGLDEYPGDEEILEAARKYCRNGKVIEATLEAQRLGNIQMTNVVLLGALVKMMPFFEMAAMRDLIEELSPERFKEANIKAFEKGKELI
ncbi:MAG: indolepyruvate oxidoreductase subunit beta [Deltaproteobacteria bacterium]|nr:indolepyruvate oxidoreductase subunit beta [Deltaproteobacteria bacterium]